MIIGVKLVQFGDSVVFSFETNNTIGNLSIYNFYAHRTAEMLLQLTAHHRAADKLEIMRLMRPTEYWPKLEPIKRIGGQGGPSKVIRVTNPALTLAHGAYVHWDGNFLTDGSIHVDLINGSSYNLAPTEYEVIG